VWRALGRGVVALGLAIVLGGIVYSRLPQSVPSVAEQSPPSADGASANPTCTVSDATARADVAGPAAGAVCLHFRDLENLELNSAAAPAVETLNLRCSYRDASADLIRVEVSRAAAADSSAGDAICHDLATDSAWQVVQ
jgi:hypothetical protein